MHSIVLILGKPPDCMMSGDSSKSLELGAQVFKRLGGFELKSQFWNVPGRQISGAWPAMQAWCQHCQTCKAQMWLQLQMLQMLKHLSLTLELYCCHWYWNCTAFTDTATLLLSLKLKLFWCNWHWNCTTDCHWHWICTVVTDTGIVLLLLTPELYRCHWHWNSTYVTDIGTVMLGKVPPTCPKIQGGGALWAIY